MPMSTWRMTSRRVIRAALKSGHERGLRGAALERHVRDAYPFETRAHWPYRIWLEEFARLVRGVEPRRRAAGPKLLGEWPMSDELRARLDATEE